MTVELQLACSLDDEVPDIGDIANWVSATLLFVDRPPADLTIRIVDEPEMTDLNLRYRGKDKPTNVLSFAFEAVPGVDYNPLGDIVICFSVIKVESNQQNIAVITHFAHMVIHGTLHLCGYDHQTDEEAEEMEVVEKGILAAISVS